MDFCLAGKELVTLFLLPVAKLHYNIPYTCIYLFDKMQTIDRLHYDGFYNYFFICLFLNIDHVTSFK